MSRIVTKITALARPSPPFSCSYHQPFSFDFREKPLPLVPFRRGAGVVERAALEMRCALAGTEGSNPSLSANQDTDPQDDEFCGFLVSEPVGSRKVSARDWIRETQLRRSGPVDCLYWIPTRGSLFVIPPSPQPNIYPQNTFQRVFHSPSITSAANAPSKTGRPSPHPSRGGSPKPYTGHSAPRSAGKAPRTDQSNKQ